MNECVNTCARMDREERVCLYLAINDKLEIVFNQTLVKLISCRIFIKYNGYNTLQCILQINKTVIVIAGVTGVRSIKIDKKINKQNENKMKGFILEFRMAHHFITIREFQMKPLFTWTVLKFMSDHLDFGFFFLLNTFGKY